MKILIDYGGHSDLWHSFHCLFEKRLGHDIYFPDGEEWVTRGYARPYPIKDLDPSVSVEEIDGERHYHVEMEDNGQGKFIVRGISFSKFLEMDFDVVMTSTYYQEEMFYRLVKECAPNAKFVRQIANIHEKSEGYCKNLLLGAAYHPRDYGGKPAEKAFKDLGMRHFIYYPEQYEGYKFTEPTAHKKVINLARGVAGEDANAWNKISAQLAPLGFTFEMYGNEPLFGKSSSFVSSGVLHKRLPQTIKNAGFIWYTKPDGGGGYTVRQALACGRPVILRKRYSSIHTIVECELFEHGVNCIDLDLIGKGNSYDLSLFREWSEPQKHQQICRQVADRFIKDTRFDTDAKEIERWIEGLPKGVK